MFHVKHLIKKNSKIQKIENMKKLAILALAIVFVSCEKHHCPEQEEHSCPEHQCPVYVEQAVIDNLAYNIINKALQDLTFYVINENVNHTLLGQKTLDSFKESKNLYSEFADLNSFDKSRLESAMRKEFIIQKQWYEYYLEQEEFQIVTTGFYDFLQLLFQ